MRPLLRVMAATTLAFALTGCGDEAALTTDLAAAPPQAAAAADVETSESPAGGPSTEPTPERAPSVERYCEVVAEADAAGTAHFAALEAREDATEQEYEEAERSFLEEYRHLFDEILTVVPDEIADELALLLRSQRERAGLGTGEPLSDETVQAAEEGVLAFEDERCADGGAEATESDADDSAGK